MSYDIERRDFLKLTAGTTAVAGLAVSLSSGETFAQDKRTLTVAWDTDVDSFDPATFKSIGGYEVQANIIDSPLMWKVQPVEGTPGLFLSKPNQYDPNIAESWSFEKDGATAVFKIRKDAKFSSGRPVNAAAVKYMFDRSLQAPGLLRILLPRLLRVTKPEQLEIRDDYTVALNMPGPSPMTLDVMSMIMIGVLDPEVVKANATSEDPWATNWLKRNSSAALGAYQVTKNEPGVEVVLEATPNHWRGKPYFERVVLKYVPNEADRVLLLKRKAVDIVVGRPGLSPRNIKSLEKEPGLKVLSVPDTFCHYVCMNTQKAPFDNVKVRQAVNYAIPIQAIIPNVLHGYGAEMKTPIPSLTPGYDPNLSPYKFDLAMARKLMAESGIKGPIAVDLAVRASWAPHEQAAVWLQTELDKIGFKINIVKQTDATFRQLATKGDLQMSVESWQSWVNDPLYHLFFNFHSTAGSTNPSFYKNPVVDKLIDDNMHEVDAAKRLAAVKELQKILIGDAVWGFLWYDNWTRVTQSDLMGIEKRWDGYERFFNMKKG